MNRAERRRQLREEEKRVARGLDARQPAAPQVVALMRALDERVRLSLQRRSVGPLMEFVYANMTSGSRLVSDVAIACGRGCSHCCHSWVDASPAEVLFAVRSMTGDQRRRAAQAVARACERTGGKPFDERAAMVVACPLLEANACSAYAARPIVCRAAASTDAQRCRRSYLELSGEGIPVPVVWRTLGQAYAVALEGAILHAGLVPTAREWNDSLRLALAQPDAESRWFAGEDVFRDAPRAAVTDAFANPSWAALYREAFGALPPAGG